MVIRGNIRGNGIQLAHYLLSGEVNENVQILDVAGRPNATERYLHQTMQGMSLTAELTKSQKGLYHAQINPAYSEDRKMTRKDWLRATDILAQELGLSEQRRVVVLHTKKNRTHAHVVFERYDHQTGKVVENKFSRLAQDRARKEMERVFEHQPTPHRNKHRPELKETLTNLWNQTETGKEFVRAVHENGYLLAEGVPRHPFMVVDEHGRSFDLVRQLNSIRIKEVRQRLRHEELIPEKEAIEIMRQKQEGSSEASKAGQQRDIDREKAVRTASLYWDTKQETTLESAAVQSQKRMKNLAVSFMQSGQDMTERTKPEIVPEKKITLTRDYFRNTDELTGIPENETPGYQPANHPDNGIETEEHTITEPQSIDRGAGIPAGEEPANAQAATIDSNAKPDHQRHQETLQSFMQSETELVDQADPVGQENKHRQQATARQFFDNEDMTASAPIDEEKAIQKLMQEQKDIRERSRQRAKRRSH